MTLLRTVGERDKDVLDHLAERYLTLAEALVMAEVATGIDARSSVMPAPGGAVAGSLKSDGCGEACVRSE